MKISELNEAQTIQALHEDKMRKKITLNETEYNLLIETHEALRQLQFAIRFDQFKIANASINAENILEALDKYTSDPLELYCLKHNLKEKEIEKEK